MGIFVSRPETSPKIPRSEIIDKIDIIDTIVTIDTIATIDIEKKYYGRIFQHGQP